MTTLAAPQVHGYQVTQQDDGRYTVHGVPLIGRVPAGTRNAPMDIEAPWMAACMSTHERLYHEGHRIPIHEYHQRDLNRLKVTDNRPLGKLRPSRVGEITVNGQRMPCLYGDMQDVRPETLDRIRSGDLAYLSVEVEDWTKPMLTSVALMPDQAPFFKFPEIRLREFSASASSKGGYVVSEFSSGEPIMLQDEPVMANPKEQEAGGERMIPGNEEGEKEPTLQDIMTALTALAQALNVAKPAEMPEEKAEEEPESKDEEDSEEAEKPEESKDEEAAGGEQAAEKVEAAPTSAEEDKYATQEPVKTAARMSALEAEVLSLRALLSQKEKNDQAEKLAQKAREELADYNLGAEAHKAIARFSAMGEESLNLFVETFKTSVTPDPPGSFMAFEYENGSRVPEAAFSAAAEAGVDKTKVYRAYAEYQQAKLHGLTAEFEDFIKEYQNGSR